MAFLLRQCIINMLVTICVRLELYIRCSIHRVYMLYKHLFILQKKILNRLDIDVFTICVWMFFSRLIMFLAVLHLFNTLTPNSASFFLNSARDYLLIQVSRCKLHHATACVFDNIVKFTIPIVNSSPVFCCWVRTFDDITLELMFSL